MRRCRVNFKSCGDVVNYKHLLQLTLSVCCQQTFYYRLTSGIIGIFKIICAAISGELTGQQSISAIRPFVPVDAQLKQLETCSFMYVLNLEMGLFTV